MQRVHLIFVLFLLAGLLLSGCQQNSDMLSPEPVALQSAADDATIAKHHNNRATGRTMIWADCNLYRSIVTPAEFKNPHGPFDQLYNGTFKDGIGHISDSKPGDKDYNGGRWHVNVLKSWVDPAKYYDACSVEDLDPNDFMSTDDYFECPLLPTKW